MPELPEVETIRRGLSKFIVNDKIKKTTILCAKSLMIHLRMTGQLIYDGKERYAAGHPSENFIDQLPNKQTRVILELQNGTLYFNDQRKFGFIKVLDTKEVENDPFIKKLQKHSAPIKAIILDQTTIAGLGNRQGQPCPVCGEVIKKIKVASRGTHICPNCQKEKK